MHADAVHYDDTRGGFRRGRVDRQELAAGRDFEIDRISHQYGGRNFVRPALLARIVGLRKTGDRHSETGQEHRGATYKAAWANQDRPFEEWAGARIIRRRP